MSHICSAPFLIVGTTSIQASFFVASADLLARPDRACLFAHLERAVASAHLRPLNCQRLDANPLAGEAKRKEDERRVAEAEARLDDEAGRLEARRKQQEVAEQQQRDNEHRLAEYQAKLAAEAQGLAAERKQQEAAEVRYGDKERGLAEAEARLTAEAHRLESERKRWAGEVKRKEDERRAAEDQRKNIEVAEAQRTDAARKQQQAAEAVRKEDERRLAQVQAEQEVQRLENEGKQEDAKAKRREDERRQAASGLGTKQSRWERPSNSLDHRRAHDQALPMAIFRRAEKSAIRI